MLNFIAQSSTEITVTTVETSDAIVGAGFLLIWGMLWLVLVALSIIAMWRIFEKAGEKGWKAIIPIYNYWTLCEIVGKPGWWSLSFLFAFIPFVGWIIPLAVAIIVSLELGKAFGKDTVWSIFLLVIFSIVGYLILGLGGDKFDGSKLENGGEGPTMPTGNDSAGAPPAQSV